MILFFAGNRDLQKYFSQLAEHCHVPAKVHWCRSLCIPSFKAIALLPRRVLQEQIGYAVQTYEYNTKKRASAFFVFWLKLKAVFFFCRDFSVFSKEQPELLVMWNGMMFRRSLTVAAARQLNIPICFMENGHLPNTTVCDMSGVNAGNSMPKDVAFYKSYSSANVFSAVDLVARKPVTQKKISVKPLPEKFIFVPFQVDSDSQILVYSPWIKNMQELFNTVVAVQKELPHLRFVFKEHPSSRVNYDYLHEQLDESVGVFANDYVTQELIEKSQAVLTINSTVGIEAILFNKPVILLGQAFFSLTGIAWLANNKNELQQLLNKSDELVFDETLKNAFISYLKNDYLLPGAWKSASTEHIEQAVKRIESFAAHRVCSV